MGRARDVWIVGWLGGRGQGQAGGAVEQVALLRAEHALKTVGLDDALALLGRHGTQVANGGAHHGAALGRKVLHLVVDAARVLLLFRSQVLPDFHAVQHALLLI